MTSIISVAKRKKHVSFGQEIFRMSFLSFCFTRLKDEIASKVDVTRITDRLNTVCVAHHGT